MLAAVLKHFNEPLELEEFPEPQLDPGELLVKITAAGVCGSDVHMWQGQDPRTPLPIILGHEGVGVVEKIGGTEPKKDLYGRVLREGDDIIWDRSIVCGQCYYCAVKNQPNLCRNRWSYGIHRSSVEPPHLNGCYADHVLLVKETKVIYLGDWIDLDYIALVTAGCSGATAANAAELAQIVPGDTVLIQGAGPLGLYLVGYARSYGADRVIVSEGVKARMELARRMGADTILDIDGTTSDQRMEVVKDITHGIGVDVAFEAVGRPEPFLEGVQMVRDGGAYISVGTAVPTGTVPVDFYHHIVRKHLRLQGVWTNDTRHLVQALSLVHRNKQIFSEMVSHKFPLTEATEALNIMAKRQAIKAALVP